MALRPGGANAAGAKGMQLIMTSDTLTPGVKGLKDFVDKSVATTLRYYEPQVENSAKLNAPWTDQTTNARNGLIARSGKDSKEYWLVLAHSVPYGIWLEVRWSGKYAIIMPTLDEYGPKVIQTLNNILERYSAGGV